MGHIEPVLSALSAQSFVPALSLVSLALFLSRSPHMIVGDSHLWYSTLIGLTISTKIVQIR
ncbi:hypothetical protein BDR03DRAFT_953841 [Suillus americanus]|nr:hypothetical protein BDR03DRAFT_953841 [Suillus americanus]